MVLVPFTGTRILGFWLALAMCIFDGMAHIPQEGQLFSDLMWFARNFSPFKDHLVVQTFSDLIFNHLHLIARKPHETCDLVNKIVDAVFVSESIPFAHRSEDGRNGTIYRPFLPTSAQCNEFS